MKVNANATPRPLGLKPPPPPPPIRRSFEGVLAAANPAKAHGDADASSPAEGGLPAAPNVVDHLRQSRALGFRELGMFGGGGAENQPALADEPAIGAGAAVPATYAGGVARQPGASLRPHATAALSSPSRLVAAPTGALASALVDLPSKGGAAPVVGDALNLSAPLEDRADPESGTAPLGSRRSVRADPTPRPSSAANLVVAEGDGMLQIVAAASLTPEARQRLRKAADSLAADLGLVVSDFTLNGGPLEPPSSNPIGASHGARPR